LAGRIINIKKLNTGIVAFYRRFELTVRDNPNTPARALHGGSPILEFKRNLASIKPLQGLIQHKTQPPHSDIFRNGLDSALATLRINNHFAGQMEAGKFPFIKTIPHD
jgi:hypothetical protein